MKNKDQSLEGKRAAADAAKQKATDARAVADANPTDAALETAAKEAEATATQLETEANAPSHEQTQRRDAPTKREKGEKRIDILLSEVNKERISEGLPPLSVAEYQESNDPDDEDEEDDTPPDANRAVTVKDLQRMGVIKTATSMIAEIKDVELRTAVASELRNISKAIPEEERYKKALSLASSSKNARIAAEAARMANRRPQNYGGGGGAPPRDLDPDEGDFVPTSLEKQMMKKYPKLTQEDVLRSRRDARAGNFGATQK